VHLRVPFLRCYDIAMRDDLLELGERWFGYERELPQKKTFGCPSWYKGKKMFAFLYKDALGIKCHPKTVLQKIKHDPAVFSPFNPGDGVMKNWLMITRPDASEYEQDKAFIEACFAAME